MKSLSFKNKHSYLGNSEPTEVDDNFWYAVESVNIIDRLPKSGRPNAIDVEVNTATKAQTWLIKFGYEKCPDVQVVVREWYTSDNRVVGMNLCKTGILSGCLGQTRILLDSNYKPDSKSWVVLEVYDEDVTPQTVDNSTPRYRSQPIQIAKDYEAAVQGGEIVQSEKLNVVEALRSPLGGLNAGLTSASKLIVIGAVGYFLIRNMDTISKQYKRFAEVK